MSSKVFAYVRTSTVKQGTLGVSLEAQRDAIEAYSRRHNLEVIAWYTETQTAAKQGRPIFMSMMKLLRKHKADGLILHRLDRGSRNLRDWSDIADLTELGLQVHFAHDSLDLGTRGGRLAADVQAIVAADFVRNLRDECLKGMRGRLKQGIWPWHAPRGYVNNGKAKVKTIHPVEGAIVKELFELYATGEYNLESIAIHAFTKGLRSQAGKIISLNGISTILNCHFYYGVLSVGIWNEQYAGIHEPLISKALFDRVQDVLHSRVQRSGFRHKHIYRRSLSCASCQRKLIGETQKGHVYYRCHHRTCPKTSVREESVTLALSDSLKRLQHFMETHTWLEKALKARLTEAGLDQSSHIEDCKRKVAWIDHRIGALTDALLDGTIERTLYNEKKNALVRDKAHAENTITEIMAKEVKTTGTPSHYLELVKHLKDKVIPENPSEIRHLCLEATSNFLVSGKSITPQWFYPLSEVQKCEPLLDCDLDSCTHRTKEEWIDLFMNADKPHTNVPMSPHPPKLTTSDEIDRYLDDKLSSLRRGDI